jgi:ABC-2 type transport system permease protein
MRLVLAHTRAITLGLVREPAFVVITVLFPAMLMLFLGSSRATGPAPVRMASFATFAFLGVALFELGAETAKERESPWEAYIRVLPVGAWVRILSRLASALMLATLGAGLVVAASLLLYGVHLSGTDWLRFVVALVGGALPAALLSVWLGYTARSGKTATSLANLLYVLLAFGGGLWLRPEQLPSVVNDVSDFIPTRAWAHLTWQAATGAPWHLSDWLELAAFGALFALMAARAYERDQGQRYS